MADRRPVSTGAIQKDDETIEQRMHNNPLARQGSTVGEDFTSRFCRSASIVATAVVNNVLRFAANTKATVDDIFGSNDKKSK